jgi:hypothetical protein
MKLLIKRELNEERLFSGTEIKDILRKGNVSVVDM